MFAAGSKPGEALNTTCRIGRRCPQEFRQSLRRRGVKAGIGPASQAGDLLKGPLRSWIVPFMEHESFDAHKPKLTCNRAEIVNRLLHRVTDIDKNLERGLVCFVADVAEYAPDLGLTTPAGDLRHEIHQGARIGDPTRGSAFVEAPEIDELN